MGRRDRFSCCLSFGGVDFEEDSALFLRPLQQIFYKASVSLGAAFRCSKFLERKATKMTENTPFFLDIPQFSFFKDLEAELGVTPAFFNGLLEEDDWSFVIKLHSLIEAAATHLLVEVLDKPEAQDVISFLELSNSRTGKIAFLNSMGLLDSNSKRFIKTLSEVRNKLIHDVSNVNLSLKQFVANLPDADEKGLNKKGFNKAFKWGHTDESKVQPQKGEDQYDVHELIKLFAIICMKSSQYKIAIWLGSIIILRQFYTQVSHKRFKSELRQVDDRLIELFTNLGERLNGEKFDESSW
jgi:hypothetical protein